MTWLGCPVCSARFQRPPNQIRRARANYCSNRCRSRAASDDESVVAYAAFVPAESSGPHDAWIAQWRARRVAFEVERERLARGDWA